MPQINRIRVNNVKYNFGTQVYDDFMMRFHCRNTIYDLANGGGKSLLMLMLLQNLIPNCTLDDKQPIEKLFRPGSGNTVIHSLVEWKLDSCFQKDNFKYMTTGFCARAGKSSDDDMAENETSAKSSASVEYFNYCIFYREFGDNDIKNLPLTNGDEKITYNGLKAYLRELEKKDFNVSVKIFEKKGDYQNFISQYGLYESHWEIVRGINKTEGHVRTYFESNYRTSRKVVEDLLIEEIIQKSFNNRLSVDNDENSMAKTLMDIKDKLVELSKKHESINDYDNQTESLNAFSEYVASYGEMYEKKAALKKRLLNMAALCSAAVYDQEKNISETDEKISRLAARIEKERINIQTAEVMEEENSLKKVRESEEKLFREYTEAENQISEERKRLLKLEAAAEYRDYLSYQMEISKAEEALNNIKRNKPEILDEMRAVANELVKRKEETLSKLDGELAKLMEIENASSQKYEKAKTDFHNEEMTAAGIVSRIAMINERINDGREQMKKAMETAGILVGEEAHDEAMETFEQLQRKQEEMSALGGENESLQTKISELRENISSANALVSMLSDQHEKALEDEEKRNEIKAKLNQIKDIYGSTENISKTLSEVEAKLSRLTEKRDSLKTFADKAKEGQYNFSSSDRKRLKNYLENQYGEDVLEGRDWIKSLDRGQRRDVIKRTPFVEYAFVIKNDFQRIKEDEYINNFEADGAVIPIVSEAVLREMQHEINREMIVFAMKDLGFLRDPMEREKRIRFAMEEIENIELEIEKFKDRYGIIENDLMTVVKAQAILEMNSENPVEIEMHIQTLMDQKHIETENLEKLTVKSAELIAKIKECNKQSDELECRYNECRKASEIFAKLSQEYRNLEDEKNRDVQCRITNDSLEKDVRARRAEYETALAKREELDRKVKAVKDQIDTAIRPAAGDSSYPVEDILDETTEALEIRLAGLGDAMNSDAAGVKDKESLINHYRLSMEKAKKSIEYKGVNFHELADISPVDSEGLKAIRNRINSLEAASAGTREEYSSVSAMKNRLEGSIDHGKNQIIEKYGQYNPFDCDSTAEFIQQHRQLIESLNKESSNLQKEKKNQEKNAKELYVSKKNMERIIKNAGMVMPEDLGNLNVYEDDINQCDEIAEDFDSIVKLEYRRREEFEKRKQLLMKQLDEYDGSELSRETGLSVNMPETAEQVTNLVNSIRETNAFIMLEKERLADSIKDMERIKDNFENRCIQTCINIRTELERLPKLSNITMEGEVISIIGLSVPYVTQDQYKDRMSGYVDETVVMAESFKDKDERLKFIRNRLSWKRLFSVIVTDMNSVRINLYKRERIKDQSRYLRYEEAVGSTGQSQGIYIQFLIGIINYISSLNSAPGSGTVGKTIFIDNPFGAAKDTYIWEPIFKLLKTNHVQLVVPARGATPAITGRFDVNYILGQKLVEKRQQTVVVDYFCDTGDVELEYTRMNYEQASFEFTTN